MRVLGASRVQGQGLLQLRTTILPCTSLTLHFACQRSPKQLVHGIHHWTRPRLKPRCSPFFAQPKSTSKQLATQKTEDFLGDVYHFEDWQTGRLVRVRVHTEQSLVEQVWIWYDLFGSYKNASDRYCGFMAQNKPSVTQVCSNLPSVKLSSVAPIQLIFQTHFLGSMWFYKGIRKDLVRICLLSRPIGSNLFHLH